MEKLEFIVPTFKDDIQLMGLIYSLIAQSNNNWTAHIISDGEYEGFNEVVEHFCLNNQIKFSTIKGPNNDWGHTARNYGLKHSSEEWVVMTGADHNEAHYKHYQVLETQLRVNEIDMGCFATRSKYSKQIKLDTKSYQADWRFVENYRILYPSKVNHIKKVLYVHN